jgi:signal transduction histidine kinase
LEILDASRGAWRDLGERGEALVGRTLMEVTGADKDVLERQLEPVRDRAATQGLLKISTASEATSADAPSPSMHFLVLSASQASSPVLVAIALTFSERLHLEAQLRQRQNIETVRELVGGIAHNFNNILHSAIAYLQMAREELGEVGTPGEFLAETEDDLHEAADLVAKLQSFSEREGKAIDLSVDLSAITQEAIDLVEPSVPPDVEVHVNLDPDVIVAGDPAPLREMVVNLLTNAVEAMPSGGRVEVEVRPLEVDPDLARQHFNLTPGPHVRLTIRDTGRGMDPTMVERVFEPFYTTKEAPRVVGLGLSVAHGVVEAHSGEIDIDTEPGEGTTVRVYLPKDND